MVFATINPEVQYRKLRERVLKKITDKPGIGHSRLFGLCQNNGGGAILKTIINDLLEHNEIKPITHEHVGPGRRGVGYWPTGTTTRQVPLGSTRTGSG
jgi:hypothetical protein